MEKEKNNSSLIKLDEKVISIFEKYNLKFPSNKYHFKNVNIVIGENGSGKTRFLKAIKETFNNLGEENILYGYFPDLLASREKYRKSSNLPISTLYDSLVESKIEFENFLKEIESQNESFIIDLITYQSQTQKRLRMKTFKVLNEVYFALSGSTILNNPKNVIIIKDKNGKEIKLKDKLKTFSPGELMIFYMAIFISFQKSSKHKRIIILDEPECHLHPKALISFIKTLKNSNYFKEIWIATHSLFILPEFPFENIVYINNSEIILRNSSMYKKIFSDLLGEDNNNVRQFISDLSQWEYSEYIAECFTNPEVIDIVNKNDEQVLAFKKFLNDYDSINILDFGGGSGRLGLSLKALDHELMKKINYEILDPYSDYNGTDFKIYKDITEVNKKYNCIVVMNVLHEINPSKWVKVFKELEQKLSDNGYLFFVEVNSLVKGEMPNKVGFLILDYDELKVLFNCKDELIKLSIKELKKSVCTVIPASIICNISEKTVAKTIKVLEATTLEKIKKERATASFQTPRYYAFLTQQYINAKLYNDNNGDLDIINKSYNLEDIIKKYYGIIDYDRLVNYLIKTLRIIYYENKNILINSICEILMDSLKCYKENLNYNKKKLTESLNLIKKMSSQKKYENIVNLFLICMFVLGCNEYKIDINKLAQGRKFETVLEYLCENDKSLYYIN